jgi:hypothetical protein
MKHQHDQNRRQVEFQVGDWVWLRLNHRVAVRNRTLTLIEREDDTRS